MSFGRYRTDPADLGLGLSSAPPQPLEEAGPPVGEGVFRPLQRVQRSDDTLLLRRLAGAGLSGQRSDGTLLLRRLAGAELSGQRSGEEGKLRDGRGNMISGVRGNK